MARRVVAKAVAVSVRPLCGFAGKSIVNVGITVTIAVEATQTSHLSGIARLCGAGVGVGSRGVVTIAISVSIGPLTVVGGEGVCSLCNRPAAVSVGITVAVRIGTSISVCCGSAHNRRATVSGGGWRWVVTVTIAIGVVPLGGIGWKCVGSRGDGPQCIGVGIAVVVLIGTAGSVVAGRSSHRHTGIGTVDGGPTRIWVREGVTVGVGASEPVPG